MVNVLCRCTPYHLDEARETLLAGDADNYFLVTMSSFALFFPGRTLDRLPNIKC